MEGSGGRDGPVDRKTVPEAADLLGVSQSAVRKRIQCGTIPWDKDEKGRIYVYVAPAELGPETGEDKSRDALSGQSRDELLEVYTEQVDVLRRELERKDAILMSLTQRIPELEASQEPRAASETVMESLAKGEGTSKPEKQRRSWLYRFFFGP
jgi:hypothetical protein